MARVAHSSGAKVLHPLQHRRDKGDDLLGLVDDLRCVLRGRCPGSPAWFLLSHPGLLYKGGMGAKRKALEQSAERWPFKEGGWQSAERWHLKDCGQSAVRWPLKGWELSAERWFFKERGKAQSAK